MPLEYYKIGSVIGKGSYGEVTLARHRKDKKQYVIKKINLQSASDKERNFAEQEVQILSKLRHPNIVSYKESFQDAGGHLHIVMGYCEGGDLYHKLKDQSKTGEALSETQIIEWFVQITMALQYIHDRSILHRDLKTQNIFLTKSKIIKVGDLGIARVLDSNADMATTLIGTPYYMSPELFSNKPYNHKSDVWALGCCVYEMATLKHAFNAKDMNSLVYKILKGKLPTMPVAYSDELQTLIKAMLSHNPTERPSASRILRHPFIKKNIALFLEGTKSSRKPSTAAASSSECKDSASQHLSKANDKPDPLGVATASGVDLEFEDKDNRKQKYVVANDKKDIHARNNAKVKKLPDVIPSKVKEGQQKVVKESSRSKKAAPSNPFSRPKAVAKHRPLPPKPADDAGSNHSKASAPREQRLPKDSEAPKLSVGCPNKAARQKRRQRISQEGFPPGLVNRQSCDSVDGGSPTRQSFAVSRSSSNASVGSSSSLEGSPAAVGSQDSVSDGATASDPDESHDMDRGLRDRSSSNKSDVNGLINTLQETLNLENKQRHGSFDDIDARQAKDGSTEVAVSADERLRERIQLLREECVRGVGERDLERAYRIIDECDEDNVETELVQLIGRTKFERYGGQIWQLKFCEEFRS